jgi:uncharacterized membrane protein YvbJ
MVYCTKCGTQNPDDTVNCSKCGASLNPAPYTENRRFRYEEDMCFGGRNHIWGIVIGLFIIVLGASSLLGGNIWDKLWPAFIILVGLIIVVNALMKRS